MFTVLAIATTMTAKTKTQRGKRDFMTAAKPLPVTKANLAQASCTEYASGKSQSADHKNP
jgi:hypothetical protein